MSELIDNRAHRIRTLKHIIKHLHKGEAPELVKEQLASIVKETDATEIAAMEQELMAEGIPVEEVKEMCDLHARVLHDVTVDPNTEPVPPGHPIDTFTLENQALTELLGRLHDVGARLVELDKNQPTNALIDELRTGLNELTDLEKHYARKENLIFSCLERHDITGPSRVMWAKDDEVRELLKAAHEALRAGPLPKADLSLVWQTTIAPALEAVAEMIYKEEKVLLPMARSTLTEDEWGEIFRDSPEYGWCLVEPREGWIPPESIQPETTINVPPHEAMLFPTGALSLAQLRGMLGVLPIDITFVDADDRVRYFSEGDRVFARSKAILGRKVQQCHPPKSLDMVEKIVADFRENRRNRAEFWIQMHGKFLHIRYFAVRDEAGAYLGTLEVTQDLTALRALTGERRLLQYDEENNQERAS